MKAASRLTLSASALLATTLLLVGCGAAPDSSESETPGTGGSTDALELEAAWLDDGRMVAVVTQGSSTCVPEATDVSADGQTVSITLDAGDPNQACTADLTARASLVALPAGVDPTADVELIVTLGEATGSVELAGDSVLDGTPGDSTDYEPSAGWFGDTALVLLTWGSSTCLPIIDSAEAEGDEGTVTFVSESRMCTMDMVPRATIIDFGDIGRTAGEPFVLTLVGDNLDATLQVAER